MSEDRNAHALNVAMDLLRVPSKVRTLRSAPLPAGVLLLLRLAAEEADALLEADALQRRAPHAHREAAVFFIEEILLASRSDAYRMLGLDEHATRSQLRQHMAYLLKWLHPDRNTDRHKARLARRVLTAWNDLKHRGEHGQEKSIPTELLSRIARPLREPGRRVAATDAVGQLSGHSANGRMRFSHRRRGMAFLRQGQ